jgi:hypothetical protein
MKIWLLGAAGLLLIGRMAVTEEPAPVGNEFQVNSYTTSTQERAAVAADAQGNFVVVWQSQGSSDTDTSWLSVQAQRFDAHGSPVGGQFQVNSYTTNNQGRPTVAVDAQGNFVVVWYSAGSYGNDGSNSVQGQRFDASGARVGVMLRIKPDTLD